MVSGNGTLLALAALLATAAGQLCRCSKVYSPHCGSDGVTYGNECMFLCSQRHNPDLSLLHFGQCRQKRAAEDPEILSPCPCPKVFKPTCGTDGVTYPNSCLLKCAAKTDPTLKAVYDRPCVKHPCACPKLHRPVCGSDGTTYGNMCTFNCAQRTKRGLTLSHRGECVYEDQLGQAEDRKLKRPRVSPEYSCPCTKERHLVCGTDGRTYGNPCLLKCASKAIADLKLDYEGSCLEKTM